MPTEFFFFKVRCHLDYEAKYFLSQSGNPKGAMLTHENVVSDAAGVIKTFEVWMDTSWHLILDI